MKKKLTFIFLALVSITFALFLKYTPMGDYCAFCNHQVKENQVIFEDSLVMVLYTHKPCTAGHSLIIPKRHVERFDELTDEEMLQIKSSIHRIHEASSKVFKTSSYLLLQKNGYQVGQSVPHVHFHYIPRKLDATFVLPFVFQFHWSGLKKPLSKEAMQPIIKALQEA